MLGCDTETQSCPVVTLLSEQDRWDRELRTIRRAVRQAGQAVMEVARRYARTPVRSSHRSVVTDADIRSDRILREHLQTAFPQDSWLSQTHGHDVTRLDRERIWIVDALGGTHDLVQGYPEYAISVALVKQGRPEVAVVYNPCTQELFEAVRGRDARLNGIPIHCTSNSLPCPRVLVSRADLEQGRYHAYRRQLQLVPCGSTGLSRGLCRCRPSPGHPWCNPKASMGHCCGHIVDDLCRGTCHRSSRPSLSIQPCSIVGQWGGGSCSGQLQPSRRDLSIDPLGPPCPQPTLLLLWYSCDPGGSRGGMIDDQN